MGLFSRGKKNEPAAPIRRDKVREAIKRDMDFEEAMDRDLDGPAFNRIQKRAHQSLAGLTKAEQQWVDDARERHGYGG